MNDMEQFNADLAARNAALDSIAARIAAATTTDEVSAAARDLAVELNAAKQLAFRNSQWAKHVFPLLSRNTQVYNAGGRRMTELLNG